MSSMRRLLWPKHPSQPLLVCTKLLLEGRKKNTRKRQNKTASGGWTSSLRRLTRVQILRFVQAFNRDEETKDEDE
nr:hypothetical protein Itr_chr14CG10030 [Ipomoea trifida]